MFNYVNFESAIEKFRKSDQKSHKKNPALIKGSGYILPDFEIKRTIKIDDFTIHPTEKIIIYNKAIAYVAKIDVPDWIQNSNPVNGEALFSSVISALLSLASERFVKSYSDNFNPSLNIQTVAIHHPLKFAGIDSVSELQEPIGIIVERFRHLYNIIMQLEKKDYLAFMRSCRLYQLAMANNYVDHNLGFALMVSSIESVATKAVEVEDVFTDWKKVREKLADASKELGLKDEFYRLIPKEPYLTARFVKFIMDYAPLNSIFIESYSKKRNFGESFERLEQMTDPLNYFVHKNRDIPGEITYEKILKETYKYRSDFYHEGKSKANNHKGSNERYIKEIYVPIESPSIEKTDFKELNLDANKLWNQLNKDGLIKKRKFEKEKITSSLKNGYFGRHGGEIMQIFYRKERKRVIVATFNLMAQIGRIALTKYYEEKIGKLPNHKD